MKRKLLFGMTICIALTGITLVGSPSKAVAGFGLFGGCGWYGGCGSYGSWCQPVVYRNYRSCYRGCGWRGWRSWYGCYDACCYDACCYDTCWYNTCCCDTCCCDTCCCDTCGYSVDDCGCDTDWGTIEPSWETEQEVPDETQQEVPGEPTEAQPMPDAEASAQRSAQRSALLNVRVPANAKVFVNGRPTTSTGSQRQYVSRGLKAGSSYRYVLRAETVQNGKKVSSTRLVSLRVGQRAKIAFDFTAGTDALAYRPVQTSLKVHVPKDAKVFLSGNATQSTGSVREYNTTRMAPGEKWQAYEIRVETDSAGQKLTQTKVITLTSGQTHEVQFDFDAPQIARVSSR